MEAIRKQASKLREQVARQQQAVLKQLGHFGIETVVVDEAEQRQLQNLYNSTRMAKHFQKDIVRGIEGFVSTSSKQMEIVRRMAEDCCKYGTENQSTGSPLARAALYFGNSHSSMENERETLLGVLCDQVSEPLRVLITGAPLEDARHLTHRYERLRQEVESQAADVLRRQAKFRDPATSAESSIKLQSAEAKLSELKSAMMALGREATAAMLSVEAQQQRITFQRLLTMITELDRKSIKGPLINLHRKYTQIVAVVLLQRMLRESDQSPYPVMLSKLPVKLYVIVSCYQNHLQSKTVKKISLTLCIVDSFPQKYFYSLLSKCTKVFTSTTENLFPVSV